MNEWRQKYIVLKPKLIRFIPLSSFAVFSLTAFRFSEQTSSVALAGENRGGCWLKLRSC